LRGFERRKKEPVSLEVTDILLLLTHATIYRSDATLKSKSTMTATPMASYVHSILQTSCAVKRWRGGSKSRGKAKTQNNYLSHFFFSIARSKHNNNSIMFKSPPSATVPTTTPPSYVARNPVVHVWDANPMAGLTEAEKANARKKIAKLLRKEHSIKIIVEANKTLLCGQGDSAIIKTSPERKPAVRKEDNTRSPVNFYEYVKVSGASSPGNNRPEGFDFVKKSSCRCGSSFFEGKRDPWWIHSPWHHHDGYHSCHFWAGVCSTETGQKAQM
jgi:hypothetical protein